jgi:hypothetical protein
MPRRIRCIYVYIPTCVGIFQDNLVEKVSQIELVIVSYVVRGLSLRLIINSQPAKR